MNATVPLEIEGETYPYYIVNLAISSSYSNGKEEGNAALRLVPTRIDENGEGVYSEENAKPVLLGSMESLQEPERTAVAAIQTALQTYILTKGL